MPSCPKNSANVWSYFLGCPSALKVPISTLVDEAGVQFLLLSYQKKVVRNVIWVLDRQKDMAAKKPTLFLCLKEFKISDFETFD